MEDGDQMATKKKNTSSIKKREKAGKCVECGKETDFRGWHFVHKMRKSQSLSSSTYKRYQYWCEDHFLIHMFNLWPFKCTKECHDEREKKLDIIFHREDTYVWVPMEATLIPAGKPVKHAGGESFPMKPQSPKCPWCKKNMEIVSELFKKRKK